MGIEKIESKIAELLNKDVSMDEKLKTLITTVRTELPENIVQDIEQGAGKLEETLLGLSPIEVGNKIPNMKLPDHLGNLVNVPGDIDTPFILTFYRGEWCPYCNLQLREFQKNVNKLNQAGVELIAVSPQTPEKSRDTKEKNQLDFKVLSDIDNKLAEAFGLTFEVPEEHLKVFETLNTPLEFFNGKVRRVLPDPATFLIRSDGHVLWRFIPRNYRKRVELKELMDEINRNI